MSDGWGGMMRDDQMRPEKIKKEDPNAEKIMKMDGVDWNVMGFETSEEARERRKREEAEGDGDHCDCRICKPPKDLLEQKCPCADEQGKFCNHDMGKGEGFCESCMNFRTVADCMHASFHD
jgi:hypothetical protein